MFSSTFFVLFSMTIGYSAKAVYGKAGVYTEPAIFERLSHFKDAGLVNHLNTVDEAMIADGIYRMFHRG